MLISCPKCNSVYNISETRVPVGGKKFKCAECGNIWIVFPEDVKKIEPEEKNINIVDRGDIRRENEDINAMFSRLSHNTKNLFTGESSVDKMSKIEKFKHFCLNFFSAYTIIAFLLVFSIIMGLYLAYQNRYSIVANIPEMEKIYAKFGVESVYNGENIIFRDVRVKELDYSDRFTVEISGRLFNSGKNSTKVLPVKASFINDKDEVVDEITELLPMQPLSPNASVLFRIVTDSPDSSIRKVKLSLEDITEK
ncbi:MAG: zinc-ribbon domain-containing protein [Alphaproteobacteria bacterium]|nr:zinc-ribbon domain-containing protein [Alphaproteobacteria bacterium]